MEIAIIGAGNVGRGLAAAAVQAGHSVAISATEAENARAAADASGARAAVSNLAAVEGADVVVLAVPYAAVEEIASELATALDGKIVIDVTNRPTPDLASAHPETVSAAEAIQARLPRARVVKAFNTIFAGRLASPVLDGTQLDGFVAADDDLAKARVLELVRSLGFRPVDAGPLGFARTLESMAWLNISLNMRNGWSWQDGWKLAGPLAA
jgi:hypothetical protein